MVNTGVAVLGDQIDVISNIKFARVIVEARTSNRDDAFTYSIPAHLEVRVGQLVRIPFGSRFIRGIVIELKEFPDVNYTKPIDSIIEHAPLIDLQKLSMAKWISNYYRSSLFEAISPMLPPGLRQRPSIHIEVKADPATIDHIDLQKGEKALMEFLVQSSNSTYSLQGLINSRGAWVRNTVMRLSDKGLIELVTREHTRKHSSERPNFLELISKGESLRMFITNHPQAKRQLALLNELAKRNRLELVRARKFFGSNAVASIVNAGLARLITANAAGDRPVILELPKLPTPEQKKALDHIKQSLDEKLTSNGTTWLLHGITGSGKTEIYLQAIAHCLELGGNAIVLVPELALTPQILGRFKARFSSSVGILHSGMTINQQGEEWWKILNGDRNIVIGTRSALFAPLSDVGLIILDEEHEWTYKQQEPSPRYHARDVARYMAQTLGSVVILGSATPDIGTAFKSNSGLIRKLELRKRVERSGAERDTANVEIIDMREELKTGNRSIFSRALKEQLIANLESKKQSILFLNRRGSSRVIKCRECGIVVNCNRCSTGMTFHQNGGQQRLLCHHCGRQREVPIKCPKCRSTRIKFMGIGTEGVETQLRQFLPSARILRWDSDSAKNIKAHERILQSFASHDADVLIGTQMVAKGLDIPSVDLVGVVLADIGLHLPDFRASERTFQTLTQVAGRAGRGSGQGNVIIQSYMPEHYAIQAAAAQDYELFYDAEIKYRKAMLYPPYTKMIRFQLEQSNYDIGAKESMRFKNFLNKVVREWDMTSVQVIGPAPSIPHKIKNSWRWHIFVRSVTPEYLIDKVAIPPAWTVDVDPESFS